MFKRSLKTQSTALRPEAELLLCCARTRLEPATAERIRHLLQKEIDWTYLLRTAAGHNLIPLLYWNLNRTGPEAVPPTILAQLRVAFQANATRNLILTGELIKLLELFEAHDLPAIPYKGPVLAASLYDDLALRQFSDLDILVQRPDVLWAKELLLFQGYRPKPQLNQAQEAAFLQSKNHHFSLVHRQRGISLELHWEISERHTAFPLERGHFWERLEPILLKGATVRSFPPEDLLLILCVHAAKHCWERLAWICDVAELLHAHQKLDWERVMQQASALGSARMLLLGLFLASDLLAAPVPQNIRLRIQADQVIKSLAAEVQTRVFREAGSQPGGFEEYRFHFKVRERLPDKIRFCLYRTLIPTMDDWGSLSLPSTLFFLYYLIRPIRLVVKPNSD